MESQFTILAAWWGAMVATLVLFWDIYKWKMAGPNLRITLKSDYVMFNTPEHEVNTYIMVQVDNIGNSPTTITHLGFVYFKNRFNHLREHFDDDSMTVVRPSPADSEPLPYVIQPGGQWIGMADQTGDIEKKSQEGHILCRIYHSVSKKPAEQRLVINP